MMQKLNDFVGADMGDVDRYVLKQGSTMVGISSQNNRLPRRRTTVRASGTQRTKLLPGSRR